MPPKRRTSKRAKLADEQPTGGGDAVASNQITAMKDSVMEVSVVDVGESITTMSTTLQKLLDTIELLESDDAVGSGDEATKTKRAELLQEAVVLLLQLKRYQRENLIQHKKEHTILTEQRKLRQAQLLQLENIKYQKHNLIEQLNELKPTMTTERNVTSSGGEDDNGIDDVEIVQSSSKDKADEDEALIHQNLPHLLKLCSEELNVQPISGGETTTAAAAATTNDDDGDVKMGGVGGVATTSKPKKQLPAVEIIRRYFGADDIDYDSKIIDINDPNDRQLVVSKLQKDIEERAKLTRQLNELKHQTSCWTNQLATYRKLLKKDLPNKLVELERASQPLQHLFNGPAFRAAVQAQQKEQQDSEGKAEETATTSRNLLSSQRLQRIERANHLPKPLYTIFYQLSSYLDTVTIETKQRQGDFGTLPILDVTSSGGVGGGAGGGSKNGNIVSLKIPVPIISGLGGDSASSSKTSSKSVTVRFEYNHDMDMITAHSELSSASSMISSDALSMTSPCWIGELFPGDTGNAYWTTDNIGDTTDSDSGNNDKPKTKSGGENTGNSRPYHWCNYMAGLHAVPEEPETTSATKLKGGDQEETSSTEGINVNRYRSTKVVVQTLVRRVRAMTTLQWLLQTLSRKPSALPVHSTLTSSAALVLPTTVQLTNWSDETNDNLLQGQQRQLPSFDYGYRTFLVTLKRKKAHDETLTVRVIIDVARYPAIPPVWELVKVTAGASSSSVSATSHDIASSTSAVSILDALKSPNRVQPPGLLLEMSSADYGMDGLHHPSQYDGRQAGKTTASGDTSTSPQPCLFDDQLDKLVRHVNFDVEDFVDESDDTTYDWVVSHQLVALANGWEAILQTWKQQ